MLHLNLITKDFFFKHLAKKIFICFNTNIMNISKIQNSQNFYNTQTQKPKREFIDIIADNIKNPRDVQDCVAVPRGIFKAYIYLMAGSGLLSVSNFLPSNWKAVKTSLNVLGALLGIVSAVYFAKPFAVKGLSPTVEKEMTL